jgi:hypothetical protein
LIIGGRTVTAPFHPTDVLWTALLRELRFRLVDELHACGDVAGLPTTLTLISTEPLVLTLDFRVDLHAERLLEMRPLLQGLSDASMRVSVQQDEVQLALLQLGDQPADAIRELVTEFAESLMAAGLGHPAGCHYCGTTKDTEIVHHLGRTSRACPACFARRLEQHAADMEEWNRPRRQAWMSVPALCLFVAIGWAGVWTIAEWLLDWFQVQVIEINHATGMVIFMLMLGLGAALGMPLGSALKKTGLVRRAPRWLGGMFVLAGVALGELFYVMTLLFRFAGVIDLTVAAQLMPMVIASYSAFWIVMKLGLALSVGVFAVMAIEEPVPTRSAL